MSIFHNFYIKKTQGQTYVSPPSSPRQSPNVCSIADDDWGEWTDANNATQSVSPKPKVTTPLYTHAAITREQQRKLNGAQGSLLPSPEDNTSNRNNYRQSSVQQQESNSLNLRNDRMDSKPKTQYKGLSSDEYFGRNTETTAQKQNPTQNDLEQALSTGLTYFIFNVI